MDKNTFMKIATQYILIALSAFAIISLMQNIFPNLGKDSLTFIFGIPFTFLVAFKETLKYKKMILFFFLCTFFLMLNFN